MIKVQIDIDGSLSGEIGKIIAWGIQLSGDNVYEGAPRDYSPQKYDYTCLEDGGFNIKGFSIKESWSEPQPIADDDV
jgi:hypothetical protein